MGDEDTAKACTGCGKETVLGSKNEANREVAPFEWCGAEYPVLGVG
jgi:hypothetical protein